jgi:uncharacterized repeat protein (TIGR03847 family)
MNNSHDFDQPDLVVPGATGQPGNRTFFIQATEGNRTCSFKVEKQQVAALCDYLEGILADLPQIPTDQFVGPNGAQEPLGLLWVIGRLAVAYEEPDDRIVIVAEEMIEMDEELDLEIDFDDPLALIAAGFDPSTARFRMTRGQVAAFIAVGNDLVRSGRPNCRLCGKPIDPEGHACPRLN